VAHRYGRKYTKKEIRKWRSRGGRRRALNMTQEQRTEAARHAARARWGFENPAVLAAQAEQAEYESAEPQAS
jgi:hypothetical protein